MASHDRYACSPDGVAFTGRPRKLGLVDEHPMDDVLIAMLFLELRPIARADALTAELQAALRIVVGTFAVPVGCGRASRQRCSLIRLPGLWANGPGVGAPSRSTRTSTTIATCRRVVIRGVAIQGSSHAVGRATVH